MGADHQGVGRAGELMVSVARMSAATSGSCRWDPSPDERKARL